MRPGHKTPECDGRWIDISTLAHRRLLCLQCRATIDNITLEQYEDLPETRGPGEIEMKDDNEGYAGGDAGIWLPLSVIFIIACALSGFVGFMFGSMSQ